MAHINCYKLKTKNMKTSVNMIRKMGHFDVTQRTKDGFFNATELIKQWNSQNDKARDLDNFWKSTSLVEFMSEVAEHENDFKSVDFTELKNNLTYISRGKYGGTWMHPILFLKFSMYINPRFEYQVIKFVHDQLIALRNESGDLTKELNASVQRFTSIDYMTLAKGINHIIFGRHEKNIRNSASPEQAKELVELQKKLAFAIDMNYIKSFDELINEMRRIWSNRNVINVIINN